MTNLELVTAADVQLMQGLAQRVTATRPDLVNSDATFGGPAWNRGKGHAVDGASRPRRLWSALGRVRRGSPGVQMGLDRRLWPGLVGGAEPESDRGVRQTAAYRR